MVEYLLYISVIFIGDWHRFQLVGISLSHLQSSQLDTNDYLSELYHNNRNNKSTWSAPVVLLATSASNRRSSPYSNAAIRECNSFKYQSLLHICIFAYLHICIFAYRTSSYGCLYYTSVRQQQQLFNSKIQNIYIRPDHSIPHFQNCHNLQQNCHISIIGNFNKFSIIKFKIFTSNVKILSKSLKKSLKNP